MGSDGETVINVGKFSLMPYRIMSRLGPLLCIESVETTNVYNRERASRTITGPVSILLCVSAVVTVGSDNRNK